MSSKEVQKLTAFRKRIVAEQQSFLRKCCETYTNYINQIIAQEQRVVNEIQKHFDECLHRIDAQIEKKMHFSAVMRMQCAPNEVAVKRESKKRKATTPLPSTPVKKQRICSNGKAEFKLTNRRPNKFQAGVEITKYDKLQISHSNGETSVHYAGDMISVFDKNSKKAIHGKICVFYRANTDIDLISDDGTSKRPNYIKRGQKRVLIDWGWDLADIKQATCSETFERIINGKVEDSDVSFYCALNRKAPIFDERNDELIQGIFIEDECSRYIGKSEIVFSTKYKFDKDKGELVSSCVENN